MLDLKETEAVSKPARYMVCDSCGEVLMAGDILRLAVEADEQGWDFVGGYPVCLDCAQDEEPQADRDFEGPCVVCGGEVADSEGDDFGGEAVHFSCAREKGIPTYLDLNATAPGGF